MAVTNEQLYLAIGLPILLNTTALLLMWHSLNLRLTALETRVDARFEAINQRFDDMRDLWRAELHRVEGVIDARLKQLEERR